MGWGLDGGIVDLMILVSRGKVLFVGLEFRGWWVDGTGVSWDGKGRVTFVGEGKKVRSFDFEIFVRIVWVVRYSSGNARMDFQSWEPVSTSSMTMLNT